ncbi:hypothetical protein HK103_000958 [Boothiomyces macroporosus]|uniref:Uncharacterized protein n=1 Tax=Boothiomyces macroporosus TaxID=261099 RepID=A0AAD5UK28_9FUNG|nr:hypothetical protein HK103_000958 [Boothiomyces macroporosus]
MWSTRKQSSLIAAINRDEYQLNDIVKLRITAGTQLKFVQEIIQLLIQKNSYNDVEKLLVIFENSEKDIVGSFCFDLLDKLLNTPVFMKLISLACHLITKNITNKLLLYENNPLVIKISSKMNQSTVEDQIKILELLFRISKKNTYMLPGMERIDGANFLESAREFVNVYNEQEKIELCSINASVSMFKENSKIDLSDSIIDCNKTHLKILHSISIQYDEITEYHCNDNLVQIRVNRLDYKSINMSSRDSNLLQKILQKKNVNYLSSKGSFSTCLINRTEGKKEFNENWISESVFDLMHVNDKCKSSPEDGVGNSTLGSHVEKDVFEIDNVSPIKQKNQDSSIFSDNDSDSEYKPSQTNKSSRTNLKGKKTIKPRNSNIEPGPKECKLESLQKENSSMKLFNKVSHEMPGNSHLNSTLDNSKDISSNPIKGESGKPITANTMEKMNWDNQTTSSFRNNNQSCIGDKLKAKRSLPAKKRGRVTKKVQSSKKPKAPNKKDPPKIVQDVSSNNTTNPVQVGHVFTGDMIGPKTQLNQIQPMQATDQEIHPRTPSVTPFQSSQVQVLQKLPPIATPVVNPILSRNRPTKTSTIKISQILKNNPPPSFSKRTKEHGQVSIKKLKCTPLAKVIHPVHHSPHSEYQINSPTIKRDNTTSKALGLKQETTPVNKKAVQLDFSITPNFNPPIISEYELSRIAHEISKVYQAYVENAMKEVYSRVQAIEQDKTIVSKIKDHVGERIEKTLDLKKSLERICNEIKSL